MMIKTNIMELLKSYVSEKYEVFINGRSIGFVTHSTELNYLRLNIIQNSVSGVCLLVGNTKVTINSNGDLSSWAGVYETEIESLDSLHKARRKKCRR